jgi:hypothetical protein
VGAFYADDTFSFEQFVQFAPCAAVAINDEGALMRLPRFLDVFLHTSRNTVGTVMELSRHTKQVNLPVVPFFLGQHFSCQRTANNQGSSHE